MKLPTPEEIDRERVKRGGLYAFMRLAWPHIGDPNPTFSEAKHLRVLSGVLEDMTDGRRPRHVINLPPSTGKNVLTGIFWPAWVWATQDPAHRWMFVSYDASLLNRDSRKLITLLRSPWFVERFGVMLPEGTLATSNFENVHGGGLFNTSFGSAIIGWHCHTQVISDPLKAQDAQAKIATFNSAQLESTWTTISQALASRAIDQSRFARLIIMQRLHPDDPAGRALAEGWTSTVLPMRHVRAGADPLDWRTEESETLDPKRFPEAALVQLEKDAGPAVWAAQYQQDPELGGESIIKAVWLDKTCRLEDVPAGFSIQSWDLAFKDTDGSDFVAGQWWRSAYVDGLQRFFLLAEPFFDRASFLDVLRELRTRRYTWPSARIIVEDKANGPACENVLRAEMPGLIELVDPRDSKVARMSSVAPQFANEQVIFVRGAYLERWRREFPKFPRVRRDDEEDAASQAIRYLKGASLLHEAMASLRRG